MTPDLLRALLFLQLLGMLALALFYLRSRQLSTGRFLAWAALALCLPVFGPFLVICARPQPSTPFLHRDQP